MKTLHYFLLATSLLFILFVNSCKKQDYMDPRPDFTTGDTSQIGETSATITGRLIKLNGAAIEKSGHVWSSLNDVPDLKINEGVSVLGGFTTDSNSYTSVINNLLPNTIYYVRGYLTRNAFTFYGNIVVLKTNKEKILEVVTGVDSLKTFNSSLLTGYIFDLGKSSITAYGHVWSATTTTPTTADAKTNFGNLASVPKYFVSSAAGIIPATTYYYRAYGINTQGTFYGAVKSFQTATAPVPVVTTNTITANANNLTVTGTLTISGVPAATQHGFVYSKTNATPTLADSKTSQGVPGAVPFNFTNTLTGLDYNATYYVRAYATSTAGTFYGDAKSITISAAPLPAVTTNTINGSGNTITVNATVTSNGVPAATQHGFVYSKTNTTPTIADAKTSQGVPGVAPFNYMGSLGGLDYSSTYYVRAYVTSSVGTYYGVVKSLATAAAPLPVVTTNTISLNFDIITVTGTVTNNGIPAAIQHGFVYSSTTNLPTIANTHSSQGVPGAAPFNFTTTISHLALSTTYYVRAYVTSAAGTFYGNVLSITTASAVLPSVNTTSLFVNHATSIESKGSILSEGTFPVTEHGFVYSSTATVPTTTNTKVNLGAPGTVPINFVSNITMPAFNTTYYIRAYAISAAGTAYGQTLNAKTDPAPPLNPAVTTDSVFQVGTGYVFKAYGKVTVDGSPSGTQHGFVFSKTNTSPTINDTKVQLGIPPAAPSTFNTNVTTGSGGTFYVRAFITNSTGTFYGGIKTVIIIGI